MANQYTKLIIDNQEVDLFDSEELPLNVTRRVNNIEGEVQGDYSRASVTIPATKNNVNILGETRQFFNFRIEVDGAPSWNGLARVKKAKTYSQGYEAIKCNYQINLISNNASWFVLLGETLLSELTTEKVDYVGANVAAGFLSEPLVRDWVFMLIKWKEWENFVGGTHYAPSYFESTPGLNIKPLIEAAFNTIGYTIQSDFFDTDLFSKLVIPTPIPDKFPEEYNAAYLNTSVSLSAPYVSPGLTGNFPYDVIDVAAPENPTAYDNVTNFQYTVPLTGYFEVTIQATLSATPPPPGVYLAFFSVTVNGGGTTPLIGFAYTNFGPGGVPYPGLVTNQATGVVFANAGDTIECTSQVTAGLTISRASMKIVGEAIPEIGVPIDFQYLLRDWKFLDMLQGLICMFNLTFETDEDSRIVTIEPKDQYVNTVRLTTTTELKEGFYKNETKDYTKTIDHTKKGSIEFPKVAGRFDFLYDNDDEETIDFIEGINNIGIYEARYPMSSGADLGKEEKKTVPFFAKTIHVLDHETRYPNTVAVPQYCLIYPQNYILDPTANEADTDSSPRILYHGGQRFGLEDQDGYIEIFEVPGLQSRLPMTFMVNYNDNTGLDPNLGFNTQNINGTDSAGLMQRFHLQDLVRKDRGNIRNNYNLFNSLDNLNFSFRIKGIIDSQKYVVQKIEGYNPLIDAPTNFKFYLDIHPTAADVANITNSPLTGVVSFISEV